ncbi:MAG: hypothetical protein AB6733_06485 [Clostridiaceae bacterium]
MADYLKIVVPQRQRQAHRVHIVATEGSFDDTWGIELTMHNNNEAEIARVSNITLSKTEFKFECLYLNETQFVFLIRLNPGVVYEIREMTPRTTYEEIKGR